MGDGPEGAEDPQSFRNLILSGQHNMSRLGNNVRGMPRLLVGRDSLQVIAGSRPRPVFDGLCVDWVAGLNILGAT